MCIKKGQCLLLKGLISGTCVVHISYLSTVKSFDIPVLNLNQLTTESSKVKQIFTDSRVLSDFQRGRNLLTTTILGHN